MLKVSRLSLSRSTKKVLTDVTVSVSSGETFGVLGQNGAGKSSLLACLASLLKPDRGTVMYDGTDVYAHPRSFRKVCGYAPELPKLYPNLTPLEHLRFCAGLYGLSRSERKAQSENLIEAFRLGDFIQRPCSALSKGQSQRVNLALALVHSPRIVFFDEPFSGLDSESQELFQAFLQSQLAEVTVLLTAHHEPSLLASCDRVATLVHGRLEHGRLENVTKNTTSAGEAFQQVVGI